MLIEPTAQDRRELKQQLDSLADNEIKLAGLIESIGYPQPRIRRAEFSTLLRIIVSQQISTRAAEAIWGKLERKCNNDISVQTILRLQKRSLRGCGFSARKVEYAKGLAAAISNNQLDLDSLRNKPTPEVIKELVRLKGFGVWSAEIFAMFALQREDLFPADDLALQIALQRYEGLPQRPTAKQVRLITERWSPYRSAMAVLMWKYYGAATLD